MKMHIKYESLNCISNIFNQLIFEIFYFRKGGCAVCYVSNSIYYNNKSCISNEIEDIFLFSYIFILLMPKAEHIIVRIIFKTPDQLKFLNAQIILNAEWYIQGDLNIDISKNCRIFKEKNKNIIKGTNKISSGTEKYLNK